MTLFTQLQAETGTLSGWKAQTALQVLSILRSEDEFPCFFSRNACNREKLMFSFVESLDPADLDGAAVDLAAYLKRAAAWDGDVSTAEPLVMQFSPEQVHANTVAAYHEMGWQVLQHFHDNDPGAWPEGVSVEPASPFWSMCFDGVQIFVNMSVPAHEKRRSRYLGSALTLIINPRERFDLVAGDNPRGRLVRDRIRARIARYDGQPHSSLLGHYLTGDIEWWQYGLPDTDSVEVGQCPLRVRPDLKSGALAQKTKADP